MFLALELREIIQKVERIFFCGNNVELPLVFNSLSIRAWILQRER